MFRPTRLRALAALGLILWALHPGFAAETRQITMNFKEAEIETIVKFISELTGKNFIIDEKVRGKVTVISPTQLSVEEAYEVFQAILNVKDFTIVPTGKVYKIVPTRDAKQTTIETVQEDEVPPGERFVTRIWRLEYVDADTISGILAPLLSKDSSVVAYAPTNTLIITESYSNIERLLDIIKTLDVETVDTVLEIIQLNYAAADTVAKTIAQTVTEGRTPAARRRAPARAAKGAAAAPVQVQGETTAIKIIPDVRTNSLIVVADPDTLAEVKELVRALDVEISEGTGKINVYYLKNADAESVASVLTSISKDAGKGGGSGPPGQPPKPVQAQPTTGDLPVELSGSVTITADKATNSLVIIASPQDFEILKGVIEKLDVRRPQVLVEALIVEMTYDKALELGIEWRSTNDPSSDGFNVVTGTNFGEIGKFANIASSPFGGPAGFFLAAIDGTVEVGGVTFPNIAATIRTLQRRGDVNVLSTPHLLTTDNEEAEIIVSDNIPFQTSQKFDSNGNPIFTFEYRDVGLTLRFTPQINEDNYVKLKLFQEISQVVSTTTGTTENAPTTTRRSTKSTVVTRDGSTVVIGGLIQDNDALNVSSVPCLGDLPVIGYLFRVQSTTKRKTNLLVFLTPHVIKSVERLEDISRDKRSRFEDDTRAPAGQPGEEVIEPADKLRKYLDGTPQGSTQE